MKRTIFIPLILSCAILTPCFCIYVSADSPQDAKSAYANYLETHPEYTQFSLTDINNDMIPEMKLNGGGEGVYGIYSYFNGSMTEAGPGIKALPEEAYPDTGTILYFELNVNGAEVHYNSGDEGLPHEGKTISDFFHFEDNFEDSGFMRMPEDTEIEFMRSLSNWIFECHFDWGEEPYSQYNWSNLPKWDEFLMDWDILSSDMSPYEKSSAAALYYFYEKDPNIIFDKSNFTFVADVAYMQNVINGLLFDVNPKDIEYFTSEWVKEKTEDQYIMYGMVLDGPQLPFYFDQVDDVQFSQDTFSISGNIILEEGNGRSVSRDDKRYVSTFKKKIVDGKKYWAFYNIHVFDADVVTPE